MSTLKALVQILAEFFCKERKQTYEIVLSVCLYSPLSTFMPLVATHML